jgi:glycosyltransferase involved in cell wall biosynthesis
VITKLDVGGAQETVVALTRAIDRERFAPVVLAGHDPGTGGDLRPDLARAGVPVVDIPAMTRSIGAAEPAAIAQLSSALRELRPAVVQTHSSKAGVLGRLAAVASRVPHVVHTVHGWSFRDTQPAAVRHGLALLERGLALTTDRLLVVTEADQRIGLQHHIGRAEKYRVVRSGVDLAAIARGTEAQRTARVTLGLPPEQFVIGWIGRFDPLKDPTTLGRVVIEGVRTWPDARFVIIGSGPLEPSLRHQIDEGGASANVTFLGIRRDVPNLWCAFDAALLTSRAEGMPRTVIEALGAGVPVVSTRVGGVAEVVRHGENGWLAPAGDTHSLVEGLRAARERRLDATTPATMQMLEEYSTGRMVRSTEEIYDELVLTGRPRPS